MDRPSLEPGSQNLSSVFDLTQTLGFSGRSDVFARAGEKYAENLIRFCEHLRDEDLYAVYAIDTREFPQLLLLPLFTMPITAVM